MKKLTFLLSALFIAFTSVFGEAKLSVTPAEKAFSDASYVKGTASVQLKDTFDFVLDTAELTAPLELSIKGGLDGVTFKAETVEGLEPKIRVSYIATKADDYKDSIFVSAGELKDTIVVTLKVTEKVPVISVGAESIAWGNVSVADASGGIQNDITASVTEGVTLSVKEITGDDKDNFAATINGGNLEVIFTATEAKDYSATVTLQAQGAEDKAVTLSASVKAPAISLGSKKVEFTGKSYVKGQASVDIRDTALITYTTEYVSDTTLSVKGGLDGITFTAEKVVDNAVAKIRISYIATKAGEYKDSVFVNASGAKDTIEVLVTVEELVPVIDVNPDKWETEVIMTGNKVDLVSDEFTITVTNPNGSDTTYTIAGGPESAFGWNSAMKASFHATAGGVYKDTLVVSYTGAENVRIPLQVTVNVPVITVSANSLAFGEVELADATAGITDKSITVSVTGGVTVTPAISGTDADKFAAEIKDGKLEVTLTASAAGTYSATITLSAPNAEPKTIALSATVKEAAGTTACAAYSYTFTAKMDKSAKLGDYNWTLTAGTSSFNFDNNNGRGAQFGSSSSPAKTLSLVTANVAECLLNDITVNASIGSGGDGKLAVYINGTQVGETKTLTTTATDYTFYNNGNLQGDLEIRLTNTTKAMFILSIKTNTEAPVVPVDVEGVTLDKKTASVEVGKTFTLTPTITPANATNKNVTWETSDATIATIDNGVVTGVKEGSATITVKTVDGNFTDNCVVTVTEAVIPPTPSTNWVTDPTTLKAGDKIIITNIAKDIAMSTSQTAVDGKTYYRGATDFDENNISDEVEQIELVASGSNFKLKVTGGYLYFDGSWSKNWLGTNETGTDYNFMKSGDTIFVVDTENDNRLIMYNKPETGDERFSEYKQTSGARSTGGTAILLVGEVEQKTTTTLAISPKTAEVAVGKTVKLTVTRDGNDALTWGSMDETIATVTNGTVTGIKEGTVKIWASANNIGDTCVVTVTEASGETITTCEEAAEAALSVSENNEEYNNGAEYTIPGYVTEIAYAWKNGSMSFWIADTEDGGKVIEAYKCAIEKEEDAVRVGDRVKVTGKLTKFNKTPEFAANCTVEILERGDEPKNLGEKTIAEFLELKNTKDTCILTGIVANIVMDKDDETQYNKYGNFDLIEGTSKLYVYGLLTADGQAQKFIEMGIDAGDTLTIKAVYTEYQGKAQAKNAIFVSVKKGSGVVPPTPGEELNVDFAQAYTFTYEGTTYWAFDAYDYENDYPELYFDFEATDLTHLNGTHEIDYSGLWTSKKDSIEFVSGTATISCVSTETEENYAVYHVDVVLYDEDGNEYSYSFDVEVVAYDGDNSTEDNIIYIELEDVPEEQGIENTEIVLDPNAPIYNIQGMQVDRNTRGILIQNGNKFIRVQ